MGTNGCLIFTADVIEPYLYVENAPSPPVDLLLMIDSVPLAQIHLLRDIFVADILFFQHDGGTASKGKGWL